MENHGNSQTTVDVKSKLGINVPMCSYKFERNILVRRFVDWANYDFVYPEIEKFISMTEWNNGIKSPTEIFWVLAGGRCEEEYAMEKMNLEIIRDRMLEESFKPADFVDLIIFGAMNPGRQESMSIVCLGTCLKIDGKKAYPFLGGNENVLRVLGVVLEEDIIQGIEYAFLAKPMFK
ncbi:hypothetical protein CVU82_02800 [Candidatus Falkowbacteria bacterium HGW-Falkowbacteria-1]|jgi:hypothetical protein|uniref:Uncharacterized protein n=1 Tax=Candidatus Falkowbacteria bacterium HGW-Falkowbacteria-1 TaxID=2013768 RepID=A0A2N2E9W1_9BACT|nr:MAG: hypothetical protein CVU82_02800 [Candidatus Falkowbacteria bacterium HGW-Falkowbacteria-1]